MPPRELSGRDHESHIRAWDSTFPRARVICGGCDRIASRHESRSKEQRPRVGELMLLWWLGSAGSLVPVPFIRDFLLDRHGIQGWPATDKHGLLGPVSASLGRRACERRDIVLVRYISDCGCRRLWGVYSNDA